MKIAIIEDDHYVSRSIYEALQRASYPADAFYNGNDFIRALREDNYQLILLDWNLPDMTGIDIIRWLRNKRGNNIPIISISTNNAARDIEFALISGADDYICKPIDNSLLLARITAVMRRYRLSQSPDSGNIIAIGKYEINAVSRIIRVADREVVLSSIEFDLAYVFFSNINILLVRGEIEKAVWGRVIYPESKALNTHISKLRTKLHLDGGYGCRLASIYSHGFRLTTV